jgi:hypothetical protein
MAMERVRGGQALSKFEFHDCLRDWLENTDDAIIGPEDVDGRTGWIHVHDGSGTFVLHADTGRHAVSWYLQTVELYGKDLQWEITESHCGNPTAVAYGPKKLRYKSFYLYVAKGSAVTLASGRTPARAKRVTENWQTITLETAIQAVEAYNSGRYNGFDNLQLDLRGRQIFAGGLGQTLEAILEQVRFIGEDYGGVAGFRAARSLAPAVAQQIYADRDVYAKITESALPLLQAASSVETIAYLLKPFVKSLHQKRNWQVWACKFLSFLNCDAFLIEDSRVDRFFELIGHPNSAQKYVTLLHRFRNFAMSHDSWLDQLRAADHRHASCDNKLWDKVFYGVAEL